MEKYVVLWEGVWSGVSPAKVMVNRQGQKTETCRACRLSSRDTSKDGQPSHKDTPRELRSIVSKKEMRTRLTVCWGSSLRSLVEHLREAIRLQHFT